MSQREILIAAAQVVAELAESAVKPIPIKAGTPPDRLRYAPSFVRGKHRNGVPYRAEDVSWRLGLTSKGEPAPPSIHNRSLISRFRTKGLMEVLSKEAEKAFRTIKALRKTPTRESTRRIAEARILNELIIADVTAVALALDQEGQTVPRG